MVEQRAERAISRDRLKGRPPCCRWSSSERSERSVETAARTSACCRWSSSEQAERWSRPPGRAAGGRAASKASNQSRPPRGRRTPPAGGRAASEASDQSRPLPERPATPVVEQRAKRAISRDHCDAACLLPFEQRAEGPRWSSSERSERSVATTAPPLVEQPGPDSARPPRLDHEEPRLSTGRATHGCRSRPTTQGSRHRLGLHPRVLRRLLLRRQHHAPRGSTTPAPERGGRRGIHAAAADRWPWSGHANSSGSTRRSPSRSTCRLVAGQAAGLDRGPLRRSAGPRQGTDRVDQARSPRLRSCEGRWRPTGVLGVVSTDRASLAARPPETWSRQGRVLVVKRVETWLLDGIGSAGGWSRLIARCARCSTIGGWRSTGRSRWSGSALAALAARPPGSGGVVSTDRSLRSLLDHRSGVTSVSAARPPASTPRCDEVGS